MRLLLIIAIALIGCGGTASVVDLADPGTTTSSSACHLKLGRCEKTCLFNCTMDQECARACWLNDCPESEERELCLEP